MQTFQVRGERDGARVRVHASGELDIATVPQLDACARAHIHTHTEAVELDLHEIGFMDSTGVKLLLTLEAEGQRDGWTLAILPSDPVSHVVHLLGLHEQLLPTPLQAAEPQQSSATA